MLVPPQLVPGLALSANKQMSAGLTRGPPINITPRRNIHTQTVFHSRTDRLDKQLPGMSINSITCLQQAKERLKI